MGDFNLHDTGPKFRHTMEPVISPYKEVYKEMQKNAKQLNSISFLTSIQSLPWPWNLCHLITVTTFSQDTGIIPTNTNTNVFVFYTGCNRRNGPDFGRVFLRSNYTDITHDTYIQS